MMKMEKEIITEANRLIESIKYHMQSYKWAKNHEESQDKNTILDLEKIIIELDGRIDMLCWVLKNNELTDRYINLLEDYDMLEWFPK